MRQAFLQNGSKSRSAQQLQGSDSDEDEPSKPAKKKSGAAAGQRPKAPAAPIRASGTSKAGARTGSKAPAPAASKGQAGSKRAASAKSQQPEPSGSTAGGSVAGQLLASQHNPSPLQIAEQSTYMMATARVHAAAIGTFWQQCMAWESLRMIFNNEMDS